MDITTEDSVKQGVRDEIRATIDEAAEKMGEVIEMLERAARAARANRLPDHVAGQLEGYTIPTLQQFAGSDDERQPGNLYSVGRSVSGDDEDEE